jgi:hypothetical protein
MRRSRALVVLPVLAVMTAVLVTAASAGAVHCKPIHARFVQTQVMTDCLSPVGFCSTAQIDSGLLKGTKAFTAMGVTLSAGLGALEPGTTLSYAGPVVIATNQGDLHVNFVGVYDTARAVFSELGRQEGGTGEFEGATGILFVTGNVTDNGTVFHSTMTGDVCLASRPPSTPRPGAARAYSALSDMPRMTGRVKGAFNGAAGRLVPAAPLEDGQVPAH